MADYKLDVEEHEGFSIISFTGYPENNVIDEMDASITRICDESARNIVIDLLELGYVYSRTISSFVKYHKIMSAKNLQIVLINPSPTVREILYVSKLTRIIPVFNTIEDFFEWSRQSSSGGEDSAIISIKTQNDVKILSFKVDPENLEFQHIGSALIDVSKKIKSAKVLLDLHNITNLNSDSIAALIELGKTVKKSHGVLVLAGVNELTKELLNILNICSLFQLADNVADGIAVINRNNQFLEAP